MLFKSTKPRIPSLTTAVLVAVLATGCSENVSHRTLNIETAPVNLSGHWEMNFGRSDQLQDRLQSLAREYRREQERQQRSAAIDRRRGFPVMGPSGSPGRSFHSVLATARLADHITRAQTLEVDQQGRLVKVHREENFSLVCDYTMAIPELDQESLGVESCYWDGTDLMYQIELPDGLDIYHRFTLAPTGDQLRIATTVNATGVAPFTLNRFYYRYEPLPEDFSCRFTLAKGRVCSKVREK